MPEYHETTRADTGLPGENMYDYLKRLQAFSEGLGEIRVVNMGSCGYDSTQITFEGETAGNKTFSIMLTISSKE